MALTLLLSADNLCKQLGPNNLDPDHARRRCVFKRESTKWGISRFVHDFMLEKILFDRRET